MINCHMLLGSLQIATRENATKLLADDIASKRSDVERIDSELAELLDPGELLSVSRSRTSNPSSRRK